MSRLEEEFKGKVEFKALDIDDAANAAAMKQYRFIGQPQFVIALPDGKVVVSRNGWQEYDRLKADIEKAIALTSQ